ncbi:MAG: FAD-dependent oxidoreductase [Planctomycetota bacterium]
MKTERFDVIVIGGGHAGVEAAWAAASVVGQRGKEGRVGLVTLDPGKIGVMSCNPAIGGLAKGQMVREVDALGGVMGLAADATGIQFKVLNRSKGPAVRGPRCQSDKYAYAREVQRLVSLREEIEVIGGAVEGFVMGEGGDKRVVGVRVRLNEPDGPAEMTDGCCGEFGCVDDYGKAVELSLVPGGSVVLTTGTFMRGLMHTGERQTAGGRVGEAGGGAASKISAALRGLGLELGRLKTGTPPRAAMGSLDVSGLERHGGDAEPVPFSGMTGWRGCGGWAGAAQNPSASAGFGGVYEHVREFPRLEQVDCWMTHTGEEVHELIRGNLDRAPMYNGQIGTAGPRYCPSIEDKVVRFADKMSHHVYLEPESLESDEVYLNGISTSLPADIQERIVRSLPGCENAVILRHGYAVEYDMVRPHQIDAGCAVKGVEGLYLAGQINGTSGYEEAAGQGLLAGLNAARRVLKEPGVVLGRDQAYIGVLMDDLVTKTPVEPYRMFTSRAEHRLLLRADNAADRLTGLGREWGLVDDARWQREQDRRSAKAGLRAMMERTRWEGAGGGAMSEWVCRSEVTREEVMAAVAEVMGDRSQATGLNGSVGGVIDREAFDCLLSDLRYAGYIERQRRDIEVLREQEGAALPGDLDYAGLPGLRGEAVKQLSKFRPGTLGQAGRIEGVNPADLLVVSVALRKQRERDRLGASA